MSLLFPILALAAIEAPAAAPGSGLPEPVRAMIEAAIADGNPKTVDAVIALARKTNPEAAEELQGIETAFRAREAEEKAEKERLRIAELENAGLLENWKGQVELGASRSTGNSDNLGLYGATNLTREGLRWRHKLTARADVQESRGLRTTERVLAAWQPNYKFDERAYTFGLAQYEHDRFLGYDDRYTLGVGGGYGLLASERVKLDIEGGPALRYTEFEGEGEETKVAGRASMTFSWAITPTLQLGQTSSVYLEKGDSSATALTTLDTKLLGALKARFSYNVQYERDAPPGRKQVDTLSRATLVYSF